MKRLLLGLLLAASVHAQNSAEYPTTVPDLQDLLVAANFAETTLASAISDSDLTLVLEDGSAFHDPAGTRASILRIDTELIKYCDRTGNTITVCAGGRGFDGTGAAVHGSGAVVRDVQAAWHHNQLAAEVVAITTALGANLVNVGGGGNSITVKEADDTPTVGLATTLSVNQATGLTVTDSGSGVATLAIGTVPDGNLPSTLTRDSEIDSEAELEAFLADVTNIFTNNDGALADDDLTNNSITDLSDVTAISGNTTTVATTSGVLTSGNCVEFDASGNLVAAGAACGSGSGTSINVEENNVEVVSSANLTGIDFLGADFDVTDDANEADIAIAAAITRDTEWDTIGEIETATGVNIIVSTEIDTFAELDALVADQTLVHSGSNIATATALAANGGNCIAGQSPLGVDASGAVEGCFSVTVPADIASMIESSSVLGTDNTIVRADGTGRNVQTSAASIDDSGNITTTGSITAGSGGGGTGSITGAAGSMTLVGGTGAGDDLIFQTTSNASKGSYILSELVNCNTIDTDASGVLSCGTDATGGGSGTPNYSESFVSATTVNMTNAEHGFGHDDLLVACYDNGTPQQMIEPASVTVNTTTYEVIVTFSPAASGVCTINGSATTVTETNNLESDGAAGIANTEVFIGTGAGTGNYAVISNDATLASTGALTLAAGITRDTEWDTAAEINAATTDDDFATLTGSQTLTNKTLTSPVVDLPATDPTTNEGRIAWNSTTNVLMIGEAGGTNYVAAGASDGDALAGDSALNFFDTGTFEDARISQSSVTQHQAALSIAGSQLSDLADFLLEAELDTIAELQAQITDATLLTTADEGTGNGIDADTVDGVEAASFATLAGAETFATGTKTITAKFDFGGGTLEIPNSTTLPATCTVGEAYMDTDATSGQRLYLCESTNTWALQGDGTGGTPSFDGISGGTNTTAAMVVGTGASLSATGSGSITATATAANSVDSDAYVDGSIDPEHISAAAKKKVIIVEVFPPGTDTATGDGKKYIPIPAELNAHNLTGINSHVISTGTANTLNIDLARCAAVATGNTCSGTVADMLSTNQTIDSGESKSSTAAAAAVIDTANDDVATDQVIRIDIDAVHTTAAQGLVVMLEFTPQ